MVKKLADFMNYRRATTTYRGGLLNPAANYDNPLSAKRLPQRKRVTIGNVDLGSNSTSILAQIMALSGLGGAGGGAGGQAPATPAPTPGGSQGQLADLLAALQTGFGTASVFRSTNPGGPSRLDIGKNNMPFDNPIVLPDAAGSFSVYPSAGALNLGRAKRRKY